MTTETVTKAQEKMFHVYKSSMESHKLITPTGGTLQVKNYQIATCKQNEIDFIDREIAAGFPYLKKVGIKTAAELDPIAELKRKMKEEARKELLAEQNAETKVHTETQVQIPQTVGGSNANAFKPASTEALANLLAKSNSK